MQRRALGRGLNALLSDKPASATDENYLEIDLDLVAPGSAQPRTRFEDAALDELAQSIRANGIVQPVLVRRVEGRYELVAGERRWRAAQRAGLQKIPAVVRDIPDDKLLELALIENIQRQELNAIEEANAFRKLIDQLGLTQESVASRIGRDRSYVTNVLRLLKLPADLQDLVQEGKLSAGHARTILGLEGAEPQRKLASEVVKKSLSVRDTERRVRVFAKTSEKQTLRARPVADVDPNSRAAETKLRRRLGTHVRILRSPNGAGGKIEIEFYGESDLDRLFQIVMGSGEAAWSATQQ